MRIIILKDGSKMIKIKMKIVIVMRILTLMEITFLIRKIINSTVIIIIPIE